MAFSRARVLARKREAVWVKPWSMRIFIGGLGEGVDIVFRRGWKVGEGGEKVEALVNDL